MKNSPTLRLGLALLTIGAIAACDTSADDDATTDDVQMGAPATTPPMASSPAITADFHAPADAPNDSVGGQVQVFPGRLTGSGGTGVAGGTGMAPDSARGAAGGGTAAGGSTADAGFTVVVRLRGLSQGEHAWHIHSGACSDAKAPIAVAMTDTPDKPGIDQPIRAQAGAMATDTAFVPGDQLTLSALRGGSYSLHVHQNGGKDHGPTVGCADLKGGADNLGGMAGDTVTRM